MKDPSGDVLPRLVERNPGGPAAEARAAQLIRGSLVPRDPTPEEVERISRAVTLRGFPRSRTRVILRVALAVGCLVVSAATVRGYEMARKAGWLGEPRTVPVTPPPPATTAKRRGEPKAALLGAPPVVDVPSPAFAPANEDAQARENPSSSPEGAVQPPAPGAPPLPGIARGREGRPGRVRPLAAESPATLAPPAQSAPLLSPEPNPGRAPAAEPGAQSLVLPPSPVLRASAQPPAISQEVLEMDRAIGSLRRDRNPEAALAALDSYLARYPHGSMEKEARLARVDALLLLGRRAQALSALEVVTVEPGLRSTELLVVRAELRAATDCRRAEEDFGLALGRGPDARLLERILYGRAACRAKLRDLTGTEEDLRRYLERFPAGPHAEWARRWRANQGSSSERER